MLCTQMSPSSTSMALMGTDGYGGSEERVLIDGILMLMRSTEEEA